MTSAPARVTLTEATKHDVAALVALMTATAQQLTADFGDGHWSHLPNEHSVLRSMRESRVLVARGPSGLMATLRLTTKKPWAIDKSYFTAVPRPLYLLDMAVEVTLQRMGIGRDCMGEAARIAREWPADAIRLDAYDSIAGAGPFYESCGYQRRGSVIYRIVPLVYYELLL